MTLAVIRATEGRRSGRAPLPTARGAAPRLQRLGLGRGADGQRTHTKSIYAKLGVNNRRAAVRRSGWAWLSDRGERSATKLGFADTPCVPHAINTIVRISVAATVVLTAVTTATEVRRLVQMSKETG